MGYHVNIIQCMWPNFLLTSQVYPMLMSSVPHAWDTFDRKNTLFKLIFKYFLKGVVFMFWHDIVYIELRSCVTNFELIWTWNKIAVVENAIKCRLYPTLPQGFVVYSTHIKTAQWGWFRWECLQYASTSCFITIIVWASSFRPLLGRTRSRGRCSAANRLSHHPEPSGRAIHAKFDRLDIGRQYGQRFDLLRHTHKPQKWPCAVIIGAARRGPRGHAPRNF